MTWCFDIDGTICSNTHGDYDAAQPFPAVIAAINRLFDSGAHILLFTARGSQTGIDWRARTEAQLRRWGVRYHELRFGKPQADVYVDDRGISAEEFSHRQGLGLAWVEAWT
jgi:hypothetical protein